MPAHELEGCFLVALWLDEEVQDRAFAIDCTPEVHPLSTDGDRHFVEVAPTRDLFHRRRLNVPQHLRKAINVTMPSHGPTPREAAAEYRGFCAGWN